MSGIVSALVGRATSAADEADTVAATGPWPLSHTMLKTRVAVGSSAALLMMLVLPAGQSVARPAEDVDIQQCLAPLGDSPRSPDVLQGWIDGCRREQVAQAAASLGNYL